MQPSPQQPILPLHHTPILPRPVRPHTRRQTLNDRIRVRRDEIGDRVAGRSQTVIALAIAIAGPVAIAVRSDAVG